MKYILFILKLTKITLMIYVNGNMYDLTFFSPALVSHSMLMIICQSHTVYLQGMKAF
jgi:hypothetical protein